MTLDQFVDVMNIAAAVLSVAALALGFYVHAVASGKISKRCEELKADYDRKIESVTNALYLRINGLGDRAQLLETRVADAAGREDLHKVSLAIERMAGDMKAIAAKMEAMGENTHSTGLAIKRLENYLLDIEGKR